MNENNISYNFKAKTCSSCEYFGITCIYIVGICMYKNKWKPNKRIRIEKLKKLKEILK